MVTTYNIKLHFYGLLRAEEKKREMERKETPISKKMINQ